MVRTDLKERYGTETVKNSTMPMQEYTYNSCLGNTNQEIRISEVSILIRGRKRGPNDPSPPPPRRVGLWQCSTEEGVSTRRILPSQAHLEGYVLARFEAIDDRVEIGLVGNGLSVDLQDDGP